MNWKSYAPVAAVSAALGCLLSVGVVSLFDLGGGHTTTVVQQAPLRGDGILDSAGGDPAVGLTPRDIYKRDAPGVVFVRAEVVQRTQQSPFDFGFPQEQQGEATGSGFVIDKDGTILTNAHVVAGATKVTVQFADKQVLEADVLGRDTSTDLAVLKVSTKDHKVTPLQLGTSRTVQVGDPTIAIGNPFGLERTLTTGVVSATKRTIQAPDGFQIDGVIQTDAAINPGNSGGPLLDAAGRVIGINSQIATGGSGGGNVGIGFAVPIDTAKRILPQLKRSGTVDRGYLGLDTVTIDRSLAALNLPVDQGALVQSVAPGGPAAKAGLRGGSVAAQIGGQEVRLGGDIITAVDGRRIRTSDDLASAIGNKKKGDKVKVGLVRDGHDETITVTLAQRPAQVQSQG
jgi:S1-C subfamily serine protease